MILESVNLKKWEFQRKLYSKVKTYDIYIAGGRKIKSITAPSISIACINFIETLDKKATYRLNSKQYASVRYKDNYSICSDFIIVEV